MYEYDYQYTNLDKSINKLCTVSLCYSIVECTAFMYKYTAHMTSKFYCDFFFSTGTNTHSVNNILHINF